MGRNKERSGQHQQGHLAAGHVGAEQQPSEHDTQRQANGARGAGQEKRVGKFGFCISGPFSKSGPAASMRSLLGSGEIQPISYGALESAMVFAKHQLMMTMRKWWGNTRPNPQ